MIRILAFVVTFLLPLSSFAESSVGCGLGSMIWKKNTVVSALFRLTTNHSFSSQLFGISTGTSGCSQHKIVMRSKEPLYFAEAHLPELKIDIARGDGQYLTGLMESFGCDQSKHLQIVSKAKKNYMTLEKSADKSSVQFLGDFITATELKSSATYSCDNII